MSIEVRPVDVRITTDGNRVIGQDVLSDGTTSIIKQEIGRGKTPEHAAVLAAIYQDPVLMVYVATGAIGQEEIDIAAEELRNQRNR